MAGGAHPEKPISLFYSYSHRDEALRGELEAHLSFLRRSQRIAEWHDQMIGAGDEWKGQIDRQLAAADIILLLVSADFIASDYCWGEEVTKALVRHRRGEARVIPVILRPCQWQSTRLGSLQAVPKDGKPVSEWLNRDAAFNEIAAAVERTIADLQQQQRGRAAEQRQQEAEETRKRVETEARQAAEEQQRETQWRREQDEDRQATGAKPEKQAERRAESEAKKPVEPQDLPDLAVFRDIDAPWCPEMVVIPAGTFVMGSPESEKGRSSAEGPQHEVTIGARFAIGRYLLPFEAYNHFCAVTNREKPNHEGWSLGRRPVINVSWTDAQAYVEWLAKKTSEPYRLPTEAEWEYACRAGESKRYTWGGAITQEKANYSESLLFKSTEVGTYQSNRWGLYDMHGNVWEWVEDVWHGNYEGAPNDGSAWTDSKGKHSSADRVLRGGCWGVGSSYLRSASRRWANPASRCNARGFRVARTIIKI